MGLEADETSADGEWTLLKASCPGLCGVGPVLLVDDDVYGNVTPARVPEILARYSEEVRRRGGEEGQGGSE
ncbi:MAG: NAD(P)H-dependent oxidoreductase subunit E [Chloroflexi bacterium]|nr:NAD(P)H-dependent oxidoreductase subunit E [Chloroflexota bacterium]